MVWGKEILWIRDDWVLLEQQFWDQDGALVKTLKALGNRPMGGRNVATLMRMGNQDKPEEWTQLQTSAVEFDLALPANQFTLSNLKSAGGMSPGYSPGAISGATGDTPGSPSAPWCSPISCWYSWSRCSWAPTR